MQVSKSEIVEIIKNAGVAANVDALDHNALLQENGVDSLDMANILLSMEEKYGTKIPDEDVPKLQSIQAMAEYLSKK